MAMDRVLMAAAFLLAAAIAGCTSSPSNYAATLSPQDPKWGSQQCQEIRSAALKHEAGEMKTRNLAPALLLGPYGVGIALAIKENQEKQRKLFARDMHMRCSSLPLPKKLQINPNRVPQGTVRD